MAERTCFVCTATSPYRLCDECGEWIATLDGGYRGFGYRVIRALSKYGGLESMAQVVVLSDQELLMIRNIGPTAVSWLRRTWPAAPRIHKWQSAYREWAEHLAEHLKYTSLESAFLAGWRARELRSEDG